MPWNEPFTFVYLNMRRGRRKFTNSQEVPDKLVEDWGLLITQYGDISGVSDKPYRVNQNSVSSYSGLDIRTRLSWIWCEWDAAIWSGLVKTLKQISYSDQTIDTLVDIQTKPSVPWHGILIHPVAIGFRGRYLSTELGTVWKFSKNLLYETFKFKILF